MRSFILIFISVFLMSCSNDEFSEVTGSVMMLCGGGGNKEVCDFLHDGALCSRQRAETARSLITQKRNNTVKNSYVALTVLDKYKACLENVVLAQSAINKSDEVSRYSTIANISGYQKKIVKETKGIKPEINLWLYRNTGKADYWRLMVKELAKTDNAHQDVYIVMMAETATHSMQDAKKIADLLLRRTEYLDDLTPEVFEFNIMYYLKSGDDFKSAIWHGLYAEYIKKTSGINSQYFKFYGGMKNTTLKNAQKVVDSIVFDTNWLGSNIKDIEELIL